MLWWWWYNDDDGDDGDDSDDDDYDDDDEDDDNGDDGDDSNDGDNDDNDDDGRNGEQSGVAGVCSSSRDRLTMIDDKHATDRWWWWLQCWHTQGIKRGINAFNEIDDYMTDQRKGKNGKLCSQAPTLELERCQKSLCLFHILIR